MALFIIRILSLSWLGLGYWLYSLMADKTYWLALVVVASIMGSAVIALGASFIRFRWSLYFLVVFWIVGPMVIWIFLDVYEFTAQWWEWIVVFPVQMAFPLLIAYSLLKSKPTRQYFMGGRKGSPINVSGQA